MEATGRDRRGSRCLAQPADSVAGERCDEPHTGIVAGVAAKRHPLTISRSPTLPVEPLRACRAAGGARYLLSRLARRKSRPLVMSLGLESKT